MQNLRLCLKKDHQVRSGDLSIEKAIYLIIEGQLVVVQIHGGKDPVFGKKIVAQGDLIKEVVLGNLSLLLETVQQEEDLGLKGILFPIPIELGKKSILFRLLEDQSRIKLLCKESGQTRFTYANWSLYDDISEHSF